MRLLAIPLLLLPCPAFAQHSLMNDEAVKASLAPGQELESRTDGDLNGDGELDTVLVGRSEEKRQLEVFLTVKGEFDVDFRKVGSLELDSYPLGPAEVVIAKGVLRITDLVGGTTAVNTIYRYRLAPGASPRMRLIGLDGTLYSRTYAHDGAEFSWNLLTGDYITRDLHLNTKGGDAAYDKVTEKKVKKASKPLFMEDTPSSAELLGWGE